MLVGDSTYVISSYPKSGQSQSSKKSVFEWHKREGQTPGPFRKDYKQWPRLGQQIALARLGCHPMRGRTWQAQLDEWQQDLCQACSFMRLHQSFTLLVWLDYAVIYRHQCPRHSTNRVASVSAWQDPNSMALQQHQLTLGPCATTLPNMIMTAAIHEQGLNASTYMRVYM